MKTNRELKNEYKELKSTMGVFQIRNTENGKILIDKSQDMRAKWNRHRMELKFGTHRTKALQSDWNKYGEVHFVTEVLSELKHEDTLNVDYDQELKELKSMVIEDMIVEPEMMYV